MKNSYKKIVLFLILITSTFSLIIPNVNAKNKIFSLDSVKVSDKSYNVGLTKLKVVEDSITNDMFFNKVGDYITYDVVVTNNSNNNYTIRKITDDSNNGYISYDYDKYKDQVVKAGESVNLKIKATYSKQSPEKLLSNIPVNFNIIYDDGKLINPQTLNNLLYVIILIMIIVFVTISIKYKKPRTSAMIILLCISIIMPIITKASSDIYTFTLNNNVSEKTIALLDTGMKVNLRIREIVTGNDLEWQYDDWSKSNICINVDTGREDNSHDARKILIAEQTTYDAIKDSLTADNIISLNESEYPIYTWFDNGNVYIYTDADIISLNEDSAYLFSYFYGAESIDNSKFITSNVTNMDHMFHHFAYNFDDAEYFELDLSNFDTSNVTNMSSMFCRCGQFAQKFRIFGLNDFNVSKVTDMSRMFIFTGEYATDSSIGDLSNWDVGSLVNAERMFDSVCGNTEVFYIGDLSNWNVSNVENMSFMLGYIGYASPKWSIGDLSNWNVSKVKNMSSMFFEAGYDAESWGIGDLSNWDTRNVEDMSWMFGEAGQNSTTWESIGTLNIYASNIEGIFSDCYNAKAVLNIHSNPEYSNTGEYSNRYFKNAATKEGSSIVINYSSRTEHIDDFIVSKSDNSNVVKGSLLD